MNPEQLAVYRLEQEAVRWREEAEMYMRLYAECQDSFAEVERCAMQLQEERDEYERIADEVTAVASDLRNKLTAVTESRDRLAEAVASALTSLGTGPAKDGYAYAVLNEALSSLPVREEK